MSSLFSKRGVSLAIDDFSGYGNPGGTSLRPPRATFTIFSTSSIRESQARARESPNSGADRNSNFIAEVPPNYLLQFTADPPENSVSVGIEFCGGENTSLLNSLQ